MGRSTALRAEARRSGRDKLLLLLGGYDKGEDPNAQRQQAEIRPALGRLTAWKYINQTARTMLFARLSPGDRNWIGAGAGRSGLEFTVNVTQHGTKVELYIDRGVGKEAEITEIFEQLLAERAEIEADFGGPLDWLPLPGFRVCSVRCVFENGGYRNEDRWPDIRTQLVDAAVRFEQALKPRIARLA